MRINLDHNNKTGSILIFSLWVLTFLTIFAVQIGLGIRSKISLLSRIEDRSQLHYLAQAGVKRAISVLRLDMQNNAGVYNIDTKINRHNNRYQFSSFDLGRGSFEIFYHPLDSLSSDVSKHYGVVDEERKLNINVADAIELKRLLSYLLSYDNSLAEELAAAILDWREFGKSSLTGFYSDEYYANLSHAYSPKDYDFEVLEELLLLKGMTQEIYEKISPFMTVYGEGQVNVNTAPKAVLVALGLDEAVAGKVLDVRMGNDGQENTADDYIFLKTYDIASIVRGFVELTEQQMKQIDYINGKGRITINSFFYKILSQASLEGKTMMLTALAVYNSNENIIEYWREKY